MKSDASPSEVLQSAPQPITGSQITVPQASASPAAIRIVESDQDINHPIADAIKVSLEQEVALMGIQPKSPAPPRRKRISEKIVPDKELDYQFVNVMGDYCKGESTGLYGALWVVYPPALSG